jgi:tetratricopeptide (TPR) repeat protein
MSEPEPHLVCLKKNNKMGKKNQQKNQSPAQPVTVAKPKSASSPMPKASTVKAPSKYTAWFYALAIFLLAVLVNSNTFKNNFVLDDHGIIKNNKITKAPVSMDNTIKIFSTPLRKGDFSDLENSLYRPFTKFLFNIEWNLFNGDPHKFHIVNVLLYGLVGIFIFFIFYDIMKKKWVIPFLISLLFIVHPIHTEVVANIKSGDEVLSLLGSVIALRCIQLYLTQNRMHYLLLGVLGFLMGSFSKESTVVVIGIIPLFIYYFTDTELKKNLSVSSFFAVCSAFFLFCRHKALSGYPPTSPLSALDNYLVLSNDNIPIRMGSAINTLGLYLKTFFVPHPLSCDYSYSSLEPIKSFADPTFLLSFLIFAGLFVYAIWNLIKSFQNKQEKSAIAFGVFWFFISVSITSNIFFLIGTSFGERLLFVPSLGLCIATIYFLSKYFYKNEQPTEGGFVQEFSSSPLLFAIILITGAFYSYKTYSRNMDWKTDFALFSRDIEYYPNSTHLLFYLGNHLSSNEYAEDKTPDQKKQASYDAIAKLTKSMSIYPALPSDGYNQLGKAYFNIGNYDSAQKYYMKAFSEDSTNAIFINNLGTIYYNTSDVFTNKGNAFMQAGRTDSANYYYFLGKNRLLEAQPYFKLAYSRDTTEPDFMNNIGCIYGATQRPDSAIYWFEKAHLSDDLDITSLNFLEITYRNMGNAQKADFYKAKLIETKARRIAERS